MPRTVTNQAALGASYAGPINAIYSYAEATPVLQETGGSLVVSDTELDVYIRNAPVSVFEPRVVFIDLDGMVALDNLAVRVYYRIYDGGGWLLYDYANYIGADGGLANGVKLIAVEMLPCRFGVRVTLQMSVGSAEFPWSAVEEA